MSISTITILSIVRIAVIIVVSFMLAIAVNKDCKKRNIRAKGLYTDLAFFLGFIGVIIYLTKRKKEPQKPPEKEIPQEVIRRSNKRFTAVIIISAILMVLNIFGTQAASRYLILNPERNTQYQIGTYYDMK